MLHILCNLHTIRHYLFLMTKKCYYILLSENEDCDEANSLRFETEAITYSKILIKLFICLFFFFNNDETNSSYFSMCTKLSE